MAVDLTPFPVGTHVKFLAGPTRIPVTGTVSAHDNGFLVVTDAAGKNRKARPGACSAA